MDWNIMDFKFIQTDKFLYFLIIISCIVSLIIIFSAGFGEKPELGEFYLRNYPKQVAENQDIYFTVVVANQGEKSKTYSMAVYSDDIKQMKTNVLLGRMTSQRYPINLKNDLEAGSHRIRIELYDEDLPYDIYGSKAKPCYIFFNVDVI